MIEQLDIEKEGVLTAYLLRRDILDIDEEPEYAILTGGVSNRAMMVKRSNGDSFVVKQALKRLRVETEWLCDPGRIKREALALKHLQPLLTIGSTPGLRFFDAENNILCMDAIDDPHDNWKTMLLRGDVNQNHIEQFAHMLAAIHRGSREQQATLKPIFEDKHFFVDLRMMPYYDYTAQFHEEAAPFFAQLIEETIATDLCLVHGDYSPKNVLVFQDNLVLLDHEVIHWGDPAFDVGFSTTHLLSKAHAVDDFRERFTQAALDHWALYSSSVGEEICNPALEARSVRHTLACLLARVDGRSPLEYLDGWQKKKQREVCLALINDFPRTMNELTQRFVAAL